MKKISFSFLALIIVISGCATVQSLVKSTFPYTATVIIPASTQTGVSKTATSAATSFDQNFGGGNNADKIEEVRITSAKIQASNPTDYSMGVFKSIKIYITKADGSDELLVASRNDIGSGANSTLQLDIDNGKFLDSYVKASTMKIKMVYELRYSANVDASLRVSLGFSANPVKTK
jgi:uncharacterized protein YceK